MTTRWQRRGRGKVARRRWRDNRGNATTSWQTRGKREGRRARGKREGRCQRTRGGGAPRGREAAAAQHEASRQPAGGASRASSSSSASFPPTGMAAPLARSLAKAAVATSPAYSMSLASAKSMHLLLSLSTPSHRRRCRLCRTRGTPFWRRLRPDHHPDCDGSWSARLHIPAFVPIFGVPESTAGFLFQPDSGGIRPQHP